MGRDETATVGESRSERMLPDEVVGELAHRIIVEQQRAVADQRSAVGVCDLPAWVAGVVTVDGSACVCPSADAKSLALVANHAAALAVLSGRAHTRADVRALAALLGVSGARRRNS